MAVHGVGVARPSPSAVGCCRGVGFVPTRRIRAGSGPVGPVDLDRTKRVSGLPGPVGGADAERRAHVGERQWRARVAYAIDDDGRTMLVGPCVPARFLEPAL